VPGDVSNERYLRANYDELEIFLQSEFGGKPHA